MGNIWTHKSYGYSVTDQPMEGVEMRDVMYRGVRASEIWYKGKRIWEGRMTFWKWARAAGAKQGGGAFRSQDYYEDIYFPTSIKPTAVNDKDTLTDYGYTQFYPLGIVEGGNPSLTTPFINEHIYVDESRYDYDRQRTPFWHYTYEPPWAMPGQGTLIITERNYDDKLGGVKSVTYSTTCSTPERFVYSEAGFASTYSNMYQNGYPVGVFNMNFVVPAGKYTLSGLPASYATINKSDRSRSYSARIGTINGELFYIDKGSNQPAAVYGDLIDYIPSYNSADPTFTLQGRSGLNIVAEVAGISNTDKAETISPKMTRSVIYQPFERAGMLRGILQTKDKSRTFSYVVNDTRDGTDTIDPTECLDPETLEYVPAVFASYNPQLGWSNSMQYTMTSPETHQTQNEKGETVNVKYTYYIQFLTDRVRISRYEKYGYRTLSRVFVDLYYTRNPSPWELEEQIRGELNA